MPLLFCRGGSFRAPMWAAVSLALRGDGGSYTSGARAARRAGYGATCTRLRVHSAPHRAHSAATRRAHRSTPAGTRSGGGSAHPRRRCAFAARVSSGALCSFAARCSSKRSTFGVRSPRVRRFVATRSPSVRHSFDARSAFTFSECSTWNAVVIMELTSCCPVVIIPSHEDEAETHSQDCAHGCPCARRAFVNQGRAFGCGF